MHEPALAELSPVDRTFLAAMAVDDGPSRMSDIAARMGVDINYANQYRRRLLQAELIEAPTRGRVELSLPNLREYLREHATCEVLASTHLDTQGETRTRTPSSSVIVTALIQQEASGFL